MMKPSGKYSRAPGAGLAGRLDQSPSTHDYRSGGLSVWGLRHDFPVTSHRFP